MKDFVAAFLVLLSTGFVLALCAATALHLRRRREGVGLGGWLFMGSIAVPAALVFVATLLGYGR